MKSDEHLESCGGDGLYFQLVKTNNTEDAFLVRATYWERFIHSFNKHVINIYSVSSIILGAAVDTVLDKRDDAPAL